MTDGERAYRGLKAKPGYQRLAELLAQGYDATAAHVEAFPSSRAKRKNRPDMVRTALSDIPGLQAAIDWLRAQDAERAGWTRQMWWEGMRRLVEFDPLRAERWTSGELQLEDLTEGERKAFTSFSITEAGEKTGGRRACRWVSPLDVYKTVAAPLGIATDRVEMTVEEADALLREVAGEEKDGGSHEHT